MSEYESINNKPKEVIVERLRVVERGGSLSFRNKNGIKIIIITVDGVLNEELSYDFAYEKAKEANCIEDIETLEKLEDR